jgi:hypothetical protein
MRHRTLEFAGREGGARKRFAGITGVEGPETHAVTETDLCVPSSLTRVTEQSLDA